MPKNKTSIFFAFCLSMLLIMGSGCFPSANSQSAPERISTTEPLPQESDFEVMDETAEGSSQSSIEEENLRNPRTNAKQVRRRQEYRQSLNNIGSWLLVVLLGIAINALVLSS